MAIKKTKASIHGFNGVDAYHRVENVVLKSKTEMRFHLRAYVSTGYPFFDEAVYTAPYNMEGKNPIKQAYEFIKSLPEFEDAEDC